MGYSTPVKEAVTMSRNVDHESPSDTMTCLRRKKTSNAPLQRHNKRGSVGMQWDAFVQLLLQWKINKYYILWPYICSLRYPSCNAHAPYCHLWPYFSTLSHKRHGLGRGDVMGLYMCVLIFSASFVWNTSHSKKNWGTYDQQCMLVFM